MQALLLGPAPRPQPSSSPKAPIGLFDSGVGGLTVLAELRRKLPSEHFIYIADQAHVPYGGRPLAEIREFASSLTRYLFARGCKMVVMACNVSTATVLEDMRTLYGDHVCGVIGPGAAEAVQKSRGKIGVLATLGTVKTGAYRRAIQAFAPNLEVHEVACPRFVPLIEAGALNTPDAHHAAHEYLSPLLAQEVDTVILGCTHYPFLKPLLQTISGGRLNFVDPAEATGRVVSQTLAAQDLYGCDGPGDTQIYTTADAARLAEQLPFFLPGVAAPVSALSWRYPETTAALTP